ncbi:hypothetical protein [Epilithonimonas xixisoli]|uniref:Uncharacterized protein n=1 Tax=Epilithonimonas xixisoli TaxID=1476462 RepID=A0A4R8I528_9FLAO|nr:hypothetical protein [Epilithonimonas xixisoli]TDX83972.1 hypothetical protein B0I22_1560 [Epilithonimonas xixisoli]
MSNTKFIKVAVSERLPKEDGKYFVWVDCPNARSAENPDEYNMNKMYFSKADNEFKSFYEVTHFLEEVPDRESELIEMLEEILKTNRFVWKNDKYAEFQIKEIESLIQSVKQPK